MGYERNRRDASGTGVPLGCPVLSVDSPDEDKPRGQSYGADQPAKSERETAVPASYWRTKVVVLVLLPLLAIAIMDHVTHAVLSMDLFYAVPVAFAVILAPRRGGWICSLVASVAAGATELAWGVTSFIAIWNALMELGVLLAVASLLRASVEQMSRSLSYPV